MYMYVVCWVILVKKIFELSKLKAFAGNNFNRTQIFESKIEFVFQSEEKIKKNEKTLVTSIFQKQPISLDCLV